MKLFIKFCVFILVLALAGPFFIKGPDGKPILTLDKLNLPSLSDLKQTASSVGNKESSLFNHGNLNSRKQLFYKWRDEQGIWQFTSSPPPTREFETLETDANANVIQSLSQNSINSDLGRQNETPEKTETGNNDTSPLDDLGGPSLTTVPIKQIPKLINDAKQARQLLQDHTKTLEDL